MNLYYDSVDNFLKFFDYKILVLNYSSFMSVNNKRYFHLILGCTFKSTPQKVI